MELEFARLQKLNELQAAISYKFKDTELLNTGPYTYVLCEG